MQIKTLQLENFRQFRGISKLEFSCDPIKNVTVILGNNTFGKTTLLQAFNWCFYGKVNFDQRSELLLNYEIAEEMRLGDQKNVEVEITLLHGNIEYIITRTQNYMCANEYSMPKNITAITRYNEDEKNPSRVKVSYKDLDGQTKAVKEHEIKEVINNILPEDLSTYFFFDTERVNNISKRKDVSLAVRGLLGLSIIDNALKHLGDREKKSGVIGNIYGKMDVKSDSKAQEFLQKIHSATERRQQIAAQIQECKLQIEKYEERKEKFSEILRDNEATTKLQHQKEDLEKKIEAEKSKLAGDIDAYFKEFNAGALAFFAQPLLKKAEEILKETKIEEKGVSNLTKATIMEILKRGRCICGREFHEGDEVYKHLEAEIKYMPPESVGNTARYCREKIHKFFCSAEETYRRLDSSYKNILHSQNLIQDFEDEVEILQEKIAGKENLQYYVASLDNANFQLRELNAKKDRLHQDDGMQKNEQERFQKMYEATLSNSEENKSLINVINYAEKIRKYLEEIYKNKEAVIRESLQRKVNEIFSEMYSGERRVEIDESYNVILQANVSGKEIESGESEGSNRVKNFAFIAGLVALAKNKILVERSDKDFILSEEPYPLVMDAPFSNADEVHTANISKILPEIAEQIIMFVMRKDWKYAEPVLREKIGKQYFLKKNTETYTQIE